MTGTVLQVSISPGGVPKRAVAAGRLGTLGIDGDLHAHPQFHGGPRQAVLLICAEVVDWLRECGYPVFYGALGENVTTCGIDHRQMRIGQRYRLGEAFIELTKVRAPCATLDVYGPSIKQEIYDQQVKAKDPASPRWARSGFYASVLQPGTIRPDDIIALVDQVV